MAQALLSIGTIVDETMERLYQEQQDLLRFAENQHIFILAAVLAARNVQTPGIWQNEARIQFLASLDPTLDASETLRHVEHIVGGASERLTEILHRLNEALQRLTLEPNWGEEVSERSTQQQDTIDIQEVVDNLVFLRDQAVEMRDKYYLLRSLWASDWDGYFDHWVGNFDETLGSGAAPAARRAVDLRLNCLSVVTMEQRHLDNETSCAICLDMFALGERCKQFPCLHVYHQSCIMPWLSSKNSCPTCRYELPVN